MKKVNREEWQYKLKTIKSIDDLPEGTTHIVYYITNLENGKQYIGKKAIYSNRRIKLGKKALAARKDKRQSKYKRVVKETNWLSYTGSNVSLNEDIDNGHKIKKVIAFFCSSSKQATFLECQELFSNKVLTEDNHLFYNDNIQGKFFSSDHTPKKKAS